MWTFNYGEWSEAYVFLRLLGNGRIYGANADFERDESIYMDILNIIRHEKNHILKFERIMENSVVNAYDNTTCFKVITCSELAEKADYLYNAIKGITSKDRIFSVSEIENYLKELKFTQPKIPELPKIEKEKYGKKTDIIITVVDSFDSAVSTTGFSIKSHLGSSSSLFNSSVDSNLKYEIVGCTDAEMDEINGNQIDSETGLFKYIRDNPNLSLKFIGVSDEFRENLNYIELTMAEILNTTMLVQIGYLDKAKSKSTKDLSAKVAEINPINVGRANMWYKAKFKELLFDSFSGLTASKPWDGIHRLSGGYIDVNKDGELLYYRAISDDIFNSFLFENTYFDRPSRGVNKDRAKVTAMAHLEGREATDEELDVVTYTIHSDGKKVKKPAKGDWGYVIKENGKYYININFQIRFR